MIFAVAYACCIFRLLRGAPTVSHFTSLDTVAPRTNTMRIGGVNVPLITPAAAAARYGLAGAAVVNCLRSAPDRLAACIVSSAGQGKCAARGLTAPANCAACAPVDRPGCQFMNTLYGKMYANGDLLSAYDA